uniref:RIMS-binding protein 2 n=1 Tax=Cacopsylla melanoneura TaxID=428564 RepID=A0A8D9EKR2_9HEMI
MRDVTERKKELEREQAECLATLREKQAAVKFKTGTDKMKCNDTIEALQSKIRELEKKTELQNVQHEELMIELASVKRSTYGLAGLTSSRTGTKDQIAAGSQTQDTQTSPPESIASTLDMNCLDRLTSSHISHSTALDSYVPRSHQRHHMGLLDSSSLSYPLTYFLLSDPPSTSLSLLSTAVSTAISTTISSLGSQHAPLMHAVSHPSHQMLSQHQHLPHHGYMDNSITVSASPAPISSATSSSGSASGMGQGGHSAEIDRIMAKIDLDNKILAELDKTRSTVAQSGSRPGKHHVTFLLPDQRGAAGPCRHLARSSSLPSGTSLQDSIGLRHTGYASTSALSTDPASYLMTNNTMIPIMGQSNLMMGGGGGGLYMLPGGSGAGSTSSAQLQSVLMSQGRIMPSIPGLGTGQYDTDTARVLLNGRGGVGVGGLHFSTQGGVESLTSRQGAGFPTAGHQLQLDKNIEFLDIPGKGRCHVYIARFTYDPTHMSPNDCPESELPIQAGDYVLVWGQIDEDGFYEGELMDGRRGLVPSNYIEKLTGEDLLEFYQTYVLGITQIDDSASTSIHQDLDYIHSARIKRGLPSVPSANRSAEDFTLKRLGQIQDYMLRDILEDPEEEDARSSEGPDVFFSVLVMPPKQLTLERQLNKSVLIGWNPPDNTPSSAIDSYHLYVDGVLKATVKSTERTRALVEGVDSNRPHRISVRSITPNRRTSRDAACTMLIGKDVPLCPTNVRASNVTATSAVISWLPSNSNHQHTVCVNNVEVRTVKPGVYRHTITGLAPNTEYRVTVRAKNIRAPNYDDKAIVPIERFSAHVDFRTLPKGSLPEPPVEIQVEPGPQDGTLLVTWLPVTANNSTNHALVTGYAVFADGKKVTDVDSPTGDHALIDINKLVGLNPRQVTVRTKSRDNQSLDSAPATVPSLNKHHHQQHNMKDEEKRKHSRERDRGDRTAVPPHMRPHRNPHGQVIIDSDENMSDKEVYPGNHMIPSIEITKDTGENYAEDDPNYRHNPGGRHHSRQAAPPKSHAERGRPPPPNISSHSRPLHVSERDQQQFHYTDRPGPGNRHDRYRGGPGGPPGGRRPQGEEKRVRWFVALYDYDPFTMSPNPDSAEEELPFNEGDNIKVYGTKDSDGFYWGELKGRRGYVPHNMVVEVDDVSKTDGKNDRWGDIYQNSTTKKMIALYDYDATQMSPNIDTEQLELSFRTGDIIYVYGGMDDDGFYMGELGGHRGLVPSNFLVEAPDYGEPPPGHGPGARGPPLPPREGVPLARGSPGPVANVGPGGRNEGIGPSDRHSRRKDKTGSSTPSGTEQAGGEGRGGGSRRASPRW